MRAAEVLALPDLVDAADRAPARTRGMPPPRPRRHARRSTRRDAARRADCGARSPQPERAVVARRRDRRGRDHRAAHQPVPRGGRAARRPGRRDRPLSSSPMAHPTLVRELSAPMSSKRGIVDLARLEAADALLGDLGDGSSLNRDEQRIAVPTAARASLRSSPRRGASTTPTSSSPTSGFVARRSTTSSSPSPATAPNRSPSTFPLRRRGPTQHRRPSGRRCTDDRSRTWRCSPGERCPVPPRTTGPLPRHRPARRLPRHAQRRLRRSRHRLSGRLVRAVPAPRRDRDERAARARSGGGRPRTCATGSSTASAACRCPAVLVGRTIADLARNTIALRSSSSSACSWGSGSMLACQRRSEVSVLSCSSPSPSPGSSRFSAWR